MRKIYKNKKKGLAFWIIGLPGSGKTTFAWTIKEEISKKFGKTVVVSGDIIRNMFHLNKFTKEERILIGKKYTEFCKFLINQNINVIFAAIGLFKDIRSYNRKLLKKNYVEIYINSNIKKIIRARKKKIYTKYKKNILAVDIKPEYPKSPDIMIKNDFKKNKTQIKKILLNKINKLVFPNYKNK
jgi:adenylylsulfate kinase-like enzyme|tara:strand:- start:1448 stop:1999 length:552 start_codon:yes stop_codon:yes gene_type:complete